MSRSMCRIVMLMIVFSLLFACRHPAQRVPGSLGIPYPYGYTAYGAATGTVVGASLHEVINAPILPLMATGGIMGGAIGNYYDRTSFAKEVEGIGGHFIILGDLVEVVLPTDYLFNEAEIELREESYPLLARLVTVLLRFGYHPILLTGYTDDIPLSRHNNEDFARYRAQAVATFLWSHGIPNGLLTVQGVGMSPDVATNRTLAGSAANRRIIIHMWT